jgi:hypothetical protein
MTFQLGQTLSASPARACISAEVTCTLREKEVVYK